MTQLRAVSHHICVKSFEQTFVGTHFVPQKTCVTRVVSRMTLQLLALRVVSLLTMRLAVRVAEWQAWHHSYHCQVG